MIITEKNYDYIISKTLEALAEHLKDNKLFILTEHSKRRKDFLYLINVFNSFKDILFKNHSVIYMEMSWLEYILNLKFYKHFNIKPFSKKSKTTSKKTSVYSIQNRTIEICQKDDENYSTLFFSPIFGQIYEAFYYEGDKNFVSDLRNLY